MSGNLSHFYSKSDLAQFFFICLILVLLFLQAEDLKVMMHRLQHWGHRLFPKMTFDEVLERVERLGAKKEVQVWLWLSSSSYSYSALHPDILEVG